MANGHWSQFSHEPKIILFHPLLIFGTILLLLMAQKLPFLVWIVGGIWAYVIIFKYIFKMPMSYTSNLIRKKLSSKIKKPCNERDGIEF